MRKATAVVVFLLVGCAFAGPAGAETSSLACVNDGPRFVCTNGFGDSLECLTGEILSIPMLVEDPAGSTMGLDIVKTVLHVAFQPNGGYNPEEIVIAIYPPVAVEHYTWVGADEGMVNTTGFQEVTTITDAMNGLVFQNGLDGSYFSFELMGGAMGCFHGSYLEVTYADPSIFSDGFESGGTDIWTQ